MSYRIGIDAGSKTIKLIVLDEQGKQVYSTYQRHRAEISKTLTEELHNLRWRLGDIEAQWAVTGSAGIAVSDLLSIPYVQEVMATTSAVKEAYPEADAVIELGGEDAKVIYLTGGLEQRMNATCAGGTGGFIDTIAYMLGVRSNAMSSLAMGCRHIYPIASRCAVFAQSDVRPLLNAGISKADIAASVLDAIVRQTLGGLACGRPLSGTIVFLGGPFEYVPYLLLLFRKALGLSADTGIKPHDAHLFNAAGVASLAPELNEDHRVRPISDLERLLQKSTDAFEPFDHLPPLAEDSQALDEFRARHARDRYPTARLFDAEGPLFLGVDAGSTTAKLAVIDQEGKLLYQDYQPIQGDVVSTFTDMLKGLYGAIDTQVGCSGDASSPIALSAVTGYGEDLLKAGFGLDIGIVETSAHLRAAQELCPDVSFVLDIGGQDIKALWVKDGQIVDAMLNEACSSGCGSFVSGTAHSLHSSPYRFANLALNSQNPVDLGMRCTVFMTSRVRQAQKHGAAIEDIAAGVAYSVIQNALYRLIGKERLGDLGDAIVVTGGTFCSDAILRAFELLTGKNAIRTDRSQVMGAIGAALAAKDRYMESHSEQAPSTLVSADYLETLSPKQSRVTCPGCQNSCALSILEFGEGRSFVSGNHCSRGLTAWKETQEPDLSSSDEENPDLPPLNLVKDEQRLLAAYGDTTGAGNRSGHTIGLIPALGLYETLPFWHRFFSELGFSVLVPSGELQASSRARAWETVASESVCYSAKLSHERLLQLVDKNAEAVFFPRFARGWHCPVYSDYSASLTSNASSLLGNTSLGDTAAEGSPVGDCSHKDPSLKNSPIKSVPREDSSCQDLPVKGSHHMLCPRLPFDRPQSIAADRGSQEILRSCLNHWLGENALALSEEEIEQALVAGLVEQKSFETKRTQQTLAVLSWLGESSDRKAVLLAGRPYHYDSGVSHDLDRLIENEGLAVLTLDGLRSAKSHNNVASRPSTTSESSWKPASRLLDAARLCQQNPQIIPVFLQSFGCGFDALSLDEVREVLGATEQPFAVFKIDDIVDKAHLRIRLRTLIQSVEDQQKSENDSVGGDSIPPTDREAENSLSEDTSSEDILSEDTFSKDTLAKSTLSEGALSRIPDTRDSEAIDALGLALDATDLDIARTELNEDLCSTANLLTARVVRILRENPEVRSVTLPHCCERCLVESLPTVVERITGTPITCQWQDIVPNRYRQMAQTGLPAASHAEKPLRIALLGNPLMVFEPILNDSVAQLLSTLGCEVIFPDPDLIMQDDVRYLDQLEAFSRLSVDQVIYLQSFGCLKGHVQSRGALRDLARRFPNLPIGILDYDPETSALNRENRIRLIVESLRRYGSTS